MNKILISVRQGIASFFADPSHSFDGLPEIKRLKNIRSYIGWTAFWVTMIMTIVTFSSPILSPRLQNPPFWYWIAVVWTFITIIALILMGLKATRYKFSKIALLSFPIFLCLYAIPELSTMMHPARYVFLIMVTFVCPVLMLVDVCFFFIHRRLINKTLPPGPKVARPYPHM